DELLAGLLPQPEKRAIDEGDHARRARRAREERNLAEALAGTEDGEALDLPVHSRVEDFDGAGLDDVESVAGIPVADDRLAGPHAELVELAGHSREILSSQAREDLRPRDGDDEVVQPHSSSCIPPARGYAEPNKLEPDGFAYWHRGHFI